VAALTTLFGECGCLFLLHVFKHLAHIMTVVAWLLFGISMTMAVVMNDLCGSMENYLEDPASSSLDALIPCLDAKTAVETLNLAREGITDAMTEIQGPGTGFGTIVAMNNRLYGNMNLLCEPYTLSSVGEICDGSSPDSWRAYEENVCKAYYNGDIKANDAAYPTTECDECCTPLFKFESTFDNLGIPDDQFEMAVSGVTAADAVRVAMPPIEALLNCEFVTNAFTKMVHGDTCDGLVGGLNLFYTGMALVSVGYTLLWVTWNVADAHITERSKLKAAARKAAKV